LFTGIIETVGSVNSARRIADGTAFSIGAADFAESIRPGDSVAVNGVCLTAERCEADEFTATAVGETLRRTSLGAARAGDRVNLERAATPDTALGGHLVQGHVDGTGRVKSFVRTGAKAGADRLLSIELPEDVYGYVVPKGSIAIDGISLTVVEQKPGRIITITIVPFTVEHTLVESYGPGTTVNVEADIIGKYVKKYLARIKIT
jgi:riboflavin synthase